MLPLLMLAVLEEGIVPHVCGPQSLETVTMRVEI